MDEKQIKTELIGESEIALAEHKARILEHKKNYDEAVEKEQKLIDILEIKLKAYKQ